jgi:hypothetical protein
MSDDLWVMEPGKGSRVLELGATRADILQRLAMAGYEVDDDEEEGDDENGEDEDHWVYVDEIDAELTFTSGMHSTLREIAITNDHVRLGPLEIVDEPLAKIVGLLQVSNEETRWTLDGYGHSASAVNVAAAETNAEPPTDEALLKGGTLWIVPFGVGFDVIYGDVLTLKLRKPGDVPTSTIGPLTPAQRELANRDDLNAILSRSAQTPLSLPAAGRFQRFAGFGLMIGLGLIVWSAIQYQKRWNDAPVAKGVVIDVKPPPPEPFPEEYTINYADDTGTQHQVVFQRNDVYVAPKIGETIDITYLPEAPGEPLGPARVRDIAMEKYVPWGIGVVAAYFILQLVAIVTGIVLQKAMTATLAPIDKSPSS